MGRALADDGRLPASLSSPPLTPHAPITTPAMVKSNSPKGLQTGWPKWILRRKLEMLIRENSEEIRGTESRTHKFLVLNPVGPPNKSQA